jgi:AcrR family transcriptional regulator
MVVATSDLPGLARIRNAALAEFARNGVASTSLRDVAKTAGVSPGLVQHHFATKAALVEAVGAHVVGLATEAFGDLPAAGTPVESQKQLGARSQSHLRRNRRCSVHFDQGNRPCK